MRMDALKFIEERNRMCDYYNSEDASPRCEGCPASQMACSSVKLVTAEYIEAVERWAQEHPRKTRQDAFLRQWPEAELVDGIIDIKPCRLVAAYRLGPECHKTFCSDCRRKFWMQEVE